MNEGIYFWQWNEPFTYEGRNIHLHYGEVEAASMDEAREKVLRILNHNRQEKLTMLPEWAFVRQAKPGEPALGEPIVDRRNQDWD